MVELGGIRAAVENIAGKLTELRAVVAALKDQTDVQASIDALQVRLEEVGAEIDSIIEDAKGTTDVPSEETPPPA